MQVKILLKIKMIQCILTLTSKYQYQQKEMYFMLKGFYIEKVNPFGLTIVVSAMDPKLLIKMLHVTFTGGPVKE